MAEKRLSEELRHCLEDDDCGDCQYRKPETKFTCRGLLQKAYEVVKQSDLISRNILIKEINKEINGIIVKDTYSKGKNAGLRKAKILAEEQSEAYYGGGWIPCEDRLPDEHKLYDITFEDSAGIHSDSAIYNPYLGRWLWDADETELVESKVLAWAEKRKPYCP